MVTVLLSVAVLGAVMLGMAVGVIFAGRTLKGSCGGVGGGSGCECTPAEREACEAEPG